MAHVTGGSLIAIERVGSNISLTFCLDFEENQSREENRQLYRVRTMECMGSFKSNSLGLQPCSNFFELVTEAESFC